MLLLVVAVVGGLALGLVRRPAGARVPRPGVHRPWLLLVGAGLQALSLTVLEADVATAGFGLSLAALVAFAGANLHLTGVAVLGLGALVNLVALVANNGIPVRPEALVRAEIVTEEELATTDVTAPRHLERSTDRLPVLGDVLPVAPARTVLSFGDLIVLLGLVDAVRELARRRRRRWTQAERQAYRLRTSQPRVVHDWGRAPSPTPVSASQCSAKPDAVAPAASEPASEAAASARSDLVAASHSR